MPTKSENNFRCNRSNWSGHNKVGLLAEHFDENPPLIPTNGHIAIDDEDKETDHISPREGGAGCSARQHEQPWSRVGELQQCLNHQL